MKREEHCRKSKELFDNDGAKFHKWLDQYAAEYGYAHRDILHNKEGIEVAVQIFGEVCREHLEQHIKDDYLLEEVPTIEELRNKFVPVV